MDKELYFAGAKIISTILFIESDTLRILENIGSRNIKCFNVPKKQKKFLNIHSGFSQIFFTF
jgi:hypothetical protein